MVGQGKGGRLANATASACHDRHATGQVEIRHGKILSAAMDFDHSPKVKALQKKLDDFMGEFIYPNQQRYREQTAGDDRWRPSALIEGLKPKARAAGLWNLFLPDSPQGGGLTNLEYAPLCEIMGRVPWAPEVFNCSAPDTGNMEILDRYGTPEQKDRWLRPLLDGKIRSGFAMTEPDVASSDATNIKSRIVRDGDDLVINGRKWWTSGAMDPRCQLLIFMGKTDAENPDRHRQQSMVLVPRGAPGVRILRWLPVFGFDDATHGHAEVDFVDVRVPAANGLLGARRGRRFRGFSAGAGLCVRAYGPDRRWSRRGSPQPDRSTRAWQVLKTSPARCVRSAAPI